VVADKEQWMAKLKSAKKILAALPLDPPELHNKPGEETRVYPVVESKDHPSFALQRKSGIPKRFHAFQENRWEVDTLDTMLSDLGSDDEYGETELKVGET
jgi:hypothetical protein